MNGAIAMDCLFAKTAKGYTEVDTKADGLPLVLRRLLIFVNGKRDLKELATLPRVDDLHKALLELEQGGYITRVPLDAPPPATFAEAAATPAPAAPPPADGFRPLPMADNPLHIQQARNFMVNTLTAFVGSFVVTALVGRLNNARSHAEFRALFPEWVAAIQGSREGRRELDKLKTELLKII
ncbi:hypothetical protein VSS37_12160 [Candidatus Thiothrix sp. Deng01]|uniref:Uncharacterized protein n=1 Tax=Candidatus Thiothrix phosphatis TaxID=3112415 RepID=A0ABU6CYW3_9GAMM|nr:hypothetical protein [Candidatus Thiothrix sp. Deng01]MEB4591737.1 hypothetical protein [Candidatus Thiothrix sp. Deng01]